MGVDEGYTRYACDREATMHDDGKKPEEYIKPGSSEESNWHLVKYMDFNQVVREYCLCNECYDKYKGDASILRQRLHAIYQSRRKLMTLHLVTAAQEEDHISSSDDARLYEAFVGSGGIVFSQGNKMSASMTDPNTMRIMDGVALLCGRYWNITNYEEVTITNGTPGMNSIALVVANIKTDPSEAVTLKVYEGVETEGEPVMPSYIEGDLNGGDTEAEMPLYAVTKTGLSVGDPMPQFEVFLSEKKFRDSISQVSVTVTPYLSNVPQYVSV